MLIRFLSWIGIIDGIVLQDHQNEIYYTKLTKSPFSDGLSAYVYPFARIGLKVLNPDGTVDNSYIVRWKYLHKRINPVKEAKAILNSSMEPH